MMHPGGAVGQEALPGFACGVQDLQTGVHDVHSDGPARTYWEHVGPKDWREVVVRVRYGQAPGRGGGPGDRGPVFEHLTTGRTPPRNVLVERGDGTSSVRPVRLLRVNRPS